MKFIDPNRTVYVYKYINLVNFKIYVGSTVDVYNRNASHKKCANKNAGSLFHRAINKYGWESFYGPDIIEVCTQESRNDRENYWIKYYGTLDDRLGYNLCLADNTELSEDTKRKISESHKGEKNPNFGKYGELNPLFGIPRPDYVVEKIRKANTGKTQSEERRRKQSETTKGKKRPAEFGLRMLGSNNPMYGKRGEDSPNFGKRHSEDSIKRMSDAQIERFKNTKVSDETKQKQKIAASRRQFTEETRKKISEALKGEKNPNFGKVGRKATEETKKKMSDRRKDYYKRKREALYNIEKQALKSQEDNENGR